MSVMALHHHGTSIGTYLFHAFIWHMIGRLVYRLPFDIIAVVIVGVVVYWYAGKFRPARKGSRK